MSRLTVSMGLAATALVLAACGNASTSTNSTSNNTGSSATSTTASTKDTITWMSLLHTAAPPSGDVEAKLEEYTGKNIEITWIPDASKDEKINAAIASDALTDIVALQQINNATTRNAMASGMFWDVEPYLKEFSNLSQISQQRLDSSRVAGHVYGVPFQKPIARYGVLIRKDWLDNLGLEVPKTLDDLRNVAQAFTEKDPDGNGQKDTVGFVERMEAFNLGFRMISGYMGAGNWFVETEDHQIQPAFMQDEYKEAMEWFKDIYANGWMNSDFSVMTKNDQKDYFVQGKGGIIFSGLQDARNFVAAAVGTEEENMELVLVNDLTYKDVPRRILSDTNGGMGGWLAIPKTKVKTEEDLKVVLQFINDLMDEEPFTLMTQGIEGRHYEIDADGVYKQIDDKLWQQEVQPYASSRPSEVVRIFKSSNDYVNIASEKIAENEAYAVYNPAQALQSTTYDQEWSTLLEPVQDAFYQFVNGELDMDGYNKVLDNFLSSGGQQVIDEFTESLKASK